MPVAPQYKIPADRRFNWLKFLMAVTLLVISAFQLYWLRENYLREKKSLTLKTDAAFRETLMRLQASKLNIDSLHWQKKINGDVKMIAVSGSARPEIKKLPPTEMISTLNLLRGKLKDSATTDKHTNVFISVRESSKTFNPDSANMTGQGHRLAPGNPIFEILYGVDSMQAPLRTGEIDSAFGLALKKEKINIPYNIVKKDGRKPGQEEQLNEVTVGFAKPVWYQVKAGNTFPYLLKQLTLPVLFSIMLLGITILSFVILYRNMLRQRRLAEAKNEFISNITHELKTPVATVGVAIEALKNFNAMQDPQRTKEYLDISSNELQRLSLLVDKVLKLSMFENQEVELQYEPVNLGQLVKEVKSSLKLQMEKNQAAITVHTGGNLDMQGDRLHLQSVVFNLLDNALKYGKGQPVIDVSVKGNEESVILKVADNGIGIAPEYIDKVFEKFFRVPHGDTHNAKGYGLGLSYAAQVIKKHNGTIAVESRKGEGTTFIITLPKQNV